jgi:hypothetical protein
MTDLSLYVKRAAALIHWDNVNSPKFLTVCYILIGSSFIMWGMNYYAIDEYYNRFVSNRRALD